ncbi:MAG: hypothetical protein J5I90_16305 [Caldilineales bacterium]|nr:hypothetical protein [Caldilineales bacterium]
MFNDPPLTPFSQSVVSIAQRAAHRRHARNLGLTDGLTDVENTGGRWDNAVWLPLISASWNQPAQRIAHLLGVARPVNINPGGKVSNAVKESERLLDEIKESQTRIIDWAVGVQKSVWSQARILQVMEEIEPKLEAAFYDEQRLAITAIGSYAAALDAIGQHDDAAALSLYIVAGLPSPDADLIDDLFAGEDRNTLLQRYGHRGDDEYEIAAPRLAEMVEWLISSAERSDAWQPHEASRRREEATSRVIAQASWLQRNNIRRTLSLVQEALPAHAHARDALAYALAAARHWVLTAAKEGVRDGRLLSLDEVFWLELEEIKQMMTGEWHSREQVEPIIKQRKTSHPVNRQANNQPGLPLGIAGKSVAAPMQRLDAPTQASNLYVGSILWARKTTPAWAACFLRAGGLMVQDGDFLCHAARVGRSGGVPMVVGCGDDVEVKTGSFTLDPTRYAPIRPE